MLGAQCFEKFWLKQFQFLKQTNLAQKSHTKDMTKILLKKQEYVYFLENDILFNYSR